MVQIKDIKWLFNSYENVNLKIYNNKLGNFEASIEFQFLNLQMTTKYDSLVVERHSIWHSNQTTLIFVKRENK